MKIDRQSAFAIVAMLLFGLVMGLLWWLQHGFGDGFGVGISVGLIIGAGLATAALGWRGGAPS